MFQANHKWLQENSENYTGQWVILLDGELLAHGERLRDILKGHPPQEALVVKIHLDEAEIWGRIGGDYDDQT